MKNRNWLVCVLLAAVLLAACSGGGDVSGSGGSVDSSGHVTLDFWYALGGDAGAAVEELVARFNASQSDITIVATYQGDYTTAMAKIYSAIAGETVPNVVQIGGAPLLGSSDTIIPITDFTTGDTSFDLASIRPAFLEYNTAGGVLWSLPFNNSVPILYYNQDLFTAAGLDPESPPQNLDELLVAAQALTTSPDASGMPTQWGLNTRDDTHWFLSTMILENGGQIVSADESQMLYNSPAAVAMLQLWGDWVNTYRVMPANQHTESLTDFLAGKLGMLLGSTSVLTSVQTQASFQVGTAMFPAVGTNRQVPLGGGSLAIFKNDDTRLLSASWEFVKFMISPESSLYLTTQTGYIPIYADALDWPEIQTLVAENPTRKAAIDSLPYAVSIPVFSALGNSWGQPLPSKPWMMPRHQWTMPLRLNSRSLPEIRLRPLGPPCTKEVGSPALSAACSVPTSVSLLTEAGYPASPRAAPWGNPASGAPWPIDPPNNPPEPLRKHPFRQPAPGCGNPASRWWCCPVSWMARRSRLLFGWQNKFLPSWPVTRISPAHYSACPCRQPVS
jgi:sn-glycerol 3-phosphate transport system substrate-binding protein